MCDVNQSQDEAMQLRSIETTPSPNCIKLNLAEAVSPKAITLQKGVELIESPVFAQQLLAIESIQSVFLFKDFITLTRQGQADWQPILAQAADVIGVAGDADAALLAQISPPQPSTSEPSTSSLPTAKLGSVEVAVQVFRGIPVQVRAIAGEGQQARVALPDRFNQALQRVILATQANYVAERRWEPYQAPSGSPEAVAQLVADEIVSLVDEDELARLETAAIANNPHPSDQIDHPQSLLADLSHANWKIRLKALQQVEVTPETFSQVVALLKDDQNTIRRWAAALLGTSGMAAAVAPLAQMVLSDPSAIVRRTAGDALSDLGDTRAMETMAQALSDSSKLVRWRAARFLNELGDESTVNALQNAVEREAEFDVRIEMMAALERIRGGGDTQIPMWQRITQSVS
jgi:Virulence factor/Scaffold protein Nfu/NifU N terminal/HEAT repeats